MAGRRSIVVVYKLVAKFYHRCVRSSETYGSLSEDVGAFNRALEDARPALLEHGKLDTYNGCLKIILDIQELLAQEPDVDLSRWNLRALINWQFAAAKLPTLTTRLHTQMMLLNLAVNSAGPNAHSVTVHEMSSAEAHDVDVQEIGGEAIYKVSGETVYEMSGEVVNEIDGDEIYEMSAVAFHEEDGEEVYEMVGSTEYSVPWDPGAVGNRAYDIRPRSQVSVQTTSTEPEFSVLEQTPSNARPVISNHSADRAPSMSRLARLSSSSRSTILSSSSLVSPSRTPSGPDKIIADFRKSVANGRLDVPALITQLTTDPAWRSQLDQESANTALLTLCKHAAPAPGHIDAIAILLQHCAADIECRDPQLRRTPLIWAISSGRADLAAALLDQHADADACDALEHSTPLIWAICRRHCALAALLLQRGASPAAADAYWRRTPLLWAAKKGALSIAELLLQSCDPRRQLLIDAKDRDGKTALAMAYVEQHPQTARVLLAHGADARFVFASGRPLLVAVVRAGFEGFARLLVERGADVRAVDVDGTPVLTVAASEGAVGIVRMLLDGGADVRARDREGCTALVWAVRRRRAEVVEVLVGAGGDGGVVDGQGRTAGEWARRGEDERIIGLVGRGK